MPGHEDRDAQRTERYLNELASAASRGALDVPADVDADPLVLAAARQLRADMARVHPSFRFEEALAERLAAAAIRLRAGLPIEAGDVPAVSGAIGAGPSTGGTLTAFPAAVSVSLPVAAAIAARGTVATAIPWRAILPAAAFRRIPEVASRPSRPFIFGGVGVASAAISIGAVYVAWRHSRPTSGRMGRAVKAAHDRSSGSGRNRRSGATHGIFGVMS
jgi:hypothetical protein